MTRHSCGRALTRTDAIAGLCQSCGQILKKSEITSALQKGSP
jgi:NMD protein affecting ribosome stability and mRNA decay